MSESKLDSDILNLPYSERQFIVVVDDLVVEKAREAAIKGENISEADWGKIGLDLAANMATKVIFGVWAPAIIITQEAMKAFSKAREMGLPVRNIGKSEAEKIVFPIGHPREGVLYVGHPAMPCTYYALAEFHRVTFEHKFCEAIYLLMSLGATKLSVEHVSGWSKEFSSRLSVPLSEVPVEASAGANAKKVSQLLYEATLSGSVDPKIPENLVWYHHEPTWQTIAKGRKDFGLLDFSLSVSYEDDFGINAGLKVTAEKAGLEMSGNFEDHQATVWRISGKFK